MINELLIGIMLSGSPAQQKIDTVKASDNIHAVKYFPHVNVYDIIHQEELSMNPMMHQKLFDRIGWYATRVDENTKNDRWVCERVVQVGESLEKIAQEFPSKEYWSKDKITSQELYEQNKTAIGDHAKNLIPGTVLQYIIPLSEK